MEQPGTLLRKRLEKLEQMPTLPVALAPLLKYLDQPIDQLDIQEVVNLISQDQSLTAQCLKMANSPAFGRWQKIDSIRGGLVALGLQRMRDIAVSCSVLRLTPNSQVSMDPVVFSEHSFGCALVCRQFARAIKFADPSKAYLCGLLHDIGIVAHLWILPNEFAATLEIAQRRHIPLHQAENATLGCSHAETGRQVAENWRLGAEVIETIGWHHDPSGATSHRALVALVGLSDLLCRMSGLGYGYIEQRQVSFLEEPGFALLLEECPALQTFDWARFTFEMDGYVEEVRRLVTALYRT